MTDGSSGAFFVSLNSVQRFQRRSRKCEKLKTDGGTGDERVITVVHLSLRLIRILNEHVERLVV